MPAPPSLNKLSPANTGTTTAKATPNKTPEPIAVKPKPAKSSAKKKTDAEWAEYYGWAVALLKSDSSLWDLFQRATAGKEPWTKQKFIAELYKTKWWTSNGDTARQTLALKKTDPETWRTRVRQIYQNIQTMAGQMGVKASWQTYWDMAEDAMMFGWDNNKLRSSLATYVSGTAYGYKGEAGQAEDQLRQYAFSMGIKLNDSALSGWIKNILKGTSTVEDYKGFIQKQAESAFPTLTEDIRGGKTVADIASAYMTSMSNILEINPGDVDVFDPKIRQALTSVNQQDGKPGTKPLWQFENELRQDPRWLKTNNARENINTVARDVLKSFGFSY